MYYVPRNYILLFVRMQATICEYIRRDNAGLSRLIEAKMCEPAPGSTNDSGIADWPPPLVPTDVIRHKMLR